MKNFNELSEEQQMEIIIPLIRNFLLSLAPKQPIGLEQSSRIHCSPFRLLVSDILLIISGKLHSIAMRLRWKSFWS